MPRFQRRHHKPWVGGAVVPPREQGARQATGAFCASCSAALPHAAIGRQQVAAPDPPRVSGRPECGAGSDVQQGNPVQPDHPIFTHFS